MDLSIVIVNWNTRDYLQACLESIEAHPPSRSYETIVVDNNSPDGSADMVNGRFPGVKLIANSENRGYAEGNNQGIEASSGRYVLLLNPDTEIKPGALDALVEFADEHPDAAAVGCRLVGRNGKVERSCRSFPSPLGVFFEYTRLSYLFPRSRFFGRYRMTYFDYSREAEVDQPMASCLLLRREAIEKVGKFDQDFPIFFNEVDWCYRAKEQGWKIYFTPSVEIMHHGGASTRQVKPEMVRESHRAMRVFYDKYYKPATPRPMYRLIVTLMAVNSFFVSRFKSLVK